MPLTNHGKAQMAIIWAAFLVWHAATWAGSPELIYDPPP